MVPGERIELPTNGLQNRCSTAELTRQINHLATSKYRLGTKIQSPMVHGVLIAGLWEQVIGNRAGRNWVCILRRLVFQAIRSEPRKPCAVMRRKSSVAFRPPVAVIEEFTRGPVLLCKLCEADRVVGGKQTRDRPSCAARYLCGYDGRRKSRDRRIATQRKCHSGRPYWQETWEHIGERLCRIGRELPNLEKAQFLKRLLEAAVLLELCGKGSADRIFLAAKLAPAAGTTLCGGPTLWPRHPTLSRDYCRPNIADEMCECRRKCVQRCSRQIHKDSLFAARGRLKRLFEFQSAVLQNRMRSGMLVTHSVMQPLGNRLGVRPLCPNCGRPMHLARITPRSGGLTDVQTFGCGECGVWATEAKEGSDDRT